MDEQAFAAAFDELGRQYWATVTRAHYSMYTRSTRLRRQGAARRYRVQLRRLQRLCGCHGCTESLAIGGRRVLPCF